MPQVAPAIVTPAVPAFAAAMAVSTFIHAGTVPAIDVEAECDLIDHVELVNHTGGQREWHRLSARCSQRAGNDNHQPGRSGDQEFAHEISLWFSVSILLILAQLTASAHSRSSGGVCRSGQINPTVRRGAALGVLPARLAGSHRRGDRVAARRCRRWVLCHEYRRSTRRYATVREMKEGPSRSAISC